MPEGSWGPQERLVVVGNGMAGMRAVEELLPARPAATPSPCSAPSHR
jgi:hypothetical protein